MPAFTFTGAKKDGRKTHGVIKACDRLDAIRQIERTGCIPLTIEDQGHAVYNHKGPHDAKLVSKPSKGIVIMLSFVVLGLLVGLTVSQFAPKAKTQPAGTSTVDGFKKKNAESFNHSALLVLQPEETETPLEVKLSPEEKLTLP